MASHSNNNDGGDRTGGGSASGGPVSRVVAGERNRAAPQARNGAGARINLAIPMRIPLDRIRQGQGRPPVGAGDEDPLADLRARLRNYETLNNELRRNLATVEVRFREERQNNILLTAQNLRLERVNARLRNALRQNDLPLPRNSDESRADDNDEGRATLSPPNRPGTPIGRRRRDDDAGPSGVILGNAGERRMRGAADDSDVDNTGNVSDTDLPLQDTPPRRSRSRTPESEESGNKRRRIASPEGAASGSSAASPSTPPPPPTAPSGPPPRSPLRPAAPAPRAVVPGTAAPAPRVAVPGLVVPGPAAPAPRPAVPRAAVPRAAAVAGVGIIPPAPRDAPRQARPWNRGAQGVTQMRPLPKLFYNEDAKFRQLFNQR